MSHRKLARMSGSEILSIITVRGDQIQDAAEALAVLEERKQFASRVETALGYRPLAAAIKEETLVAPVDVVLLKVLHKLGVRPLKLASVLRYKHDAVKNSLNLLLKAFGFPLMFSGLMAVTILLIAASRTPEVISAQLSVHWIWPALLGMGAFMVWAEHALIPRTEWIVHSLERGHPWILDRPSLVPREVLQLALRVKEELVKCEFYVHALSQDHGPWFKIFGVIGNVIADPDPFLEVRFGGESYYIAVWDEPGFDGKQMQID